MRETLHTQTFGDHGPVVVLLHGLLSIGNNLGAIARALAERARVIVPDLRNHGRSFRAAGMAYRELAADLARTLDAADIATVRLMGHSMGGKLAMQFALDYPACCERLMVADIAPVAYAPHHGPVFDALLSVAARPDADRRETSRLLEERLHDSALVSLLLMHRERQPDGSWAWRLGLEQLVAGYEEIIAAPRIDAPGNCWRGPTLFLRGERSDYVLPEHHAGITALFPDASIETLPDAGHWLHAEKQALFIPRATELLLG